MLAFEQLRELAGDYITGHIASERDYMMVAGVPPEVARKLLEEDPFGLEQQQNCSPTMEEMISLCEIHGGTLEGYIIPAESGRADARTTFEGFSIDVNEMTARMLRESLEPDEFDLNDDCQYRFWWT